jgi:hypothetical protein
MLEVLENDEDEVMFEDDDDDEGLDAGQPLVARGRRKQRRRWDQDENKTEASLLEVRLIFLDKR